MRGCSFFFMAIARAHSVYARGVLSDSEGLALHKTLGDQRFRPSRKTPQSPGHRIGAHTLFPPSPIRERLGLMPVSLGALWSSKAHVCPTLPGETRGARPKKRPTKGYNLPRQARVPTLILPAGQPIPAYL